MRVIIEMNNRNYKIKSLTNADNYFEGIGNIPKEIKNLAIFGEHNNEYLTICYYNLKEKYLRGQKDFNKDTWDKLEEFYKKEFCL